MKTISRCLIKSDWRNSMCANFCVNTQTVSSFKEPKIQTMILCSLICGLAHTTVIILPIRNVHIFFSSYKAIHLCNVGVITHTWYLFSKITSASAALKLLGPSRPPIGPTNATTGPSCPQGLRALGGGCRGNRALVCSWHASIRLSSKTIIFFPCEASVNRGLRATGFLSSDKWN